MELLNHREIRPLEKGVVLCNSGVLKEWILVHGSAVETKESGYYRQGGRLSGSL